MKVDTSWAPKPEEIKVASSIPFGPNSLYSVQICPYQVAFTSIGYVHRRIIIFLPDGLKIYNLISAPWWGRGERGRGEGLGERCEGKVTIFYFFVIRHRRIKFGHPIR